jgi:hypothetical protein
MVCRNADSDHERLVQLGLASGRSRRPQHAQSKPGGRSLGVRGCVLQYLPSTLAHWVVKPRQKRGFTYKFAWWTTMTMMAMKLGSTESVRG